MTMTRYDGFEVWFQSIRDARDLGEFGVPYDIDPLLKPLGGGYQLIVALSIRTPTERRS